MLLCATVCTLIAIQTEAQRSSKQNSKTGTSSPVEEKRKRYRSPDHKLEAIVISFKPRSYGGPESKIEVRSADGHLLAHTSYASPSGAQGQLVSKARWTSDSRFFVYATESSGGHSPWHHPTHFFSANHHKIYSLDHALGQHKPDSDKGDGAITTQFVLKSPHTVLAEGRRSNSSPGVRVGKHHQDSKSFQDVLNQPPLTIDLAIIDTLVTTDDAEHGE